MDDSKLSAMLAARSEEALKQIDRQYRRLGLQLALGITGSPEDAEECWNDALLRLWALGAEKLPENLSAYLCRIVRNEALNRVRQRSAEKRGGKVLVLALDELRTALPAGNDPADLADGMALKEALERFLWSLPPRDCEAFLQRYFYMKPVQDIARELGCSRVALSARLRRTRKQLSDCLTKEGFL